MKYNTYICAIFTLELVDMDGFTYTSIGDKCISVKRTTENQQPIRNMMNRCVICNNSTYLGLENNVDTYSIRLL